MLNEYLLNLLMNTNIEIDTTFFSGWRSVIETNKNVQLINHYFRQLLKLL